ncbi:glycoside hydrolase family 18 protein [Schizophyllum commune]
MSDASRVAVYYQTQYDAGNYVSPLPLIGFITHLYLAAYHLNFNKVGNSVTLNDHPPSDAYYDQMWPEITELQENGVKVIGMLGGAAPGTYTCLSEENWDTYYPDLYQTILDYDLDGMDLDVEQSTDIEVVTRLITQLKADFGQDFLITLAPVASALEESGNLSGFNYVDLEHRVGGNISWYNAQFYSGFGSIFPDDQYVSIVEHADGVFPPEKVVASTLTNPSLGGGYVSTDSVVQSIRDLTAVYGRSFGGVAGWEYFASIPEAGSPWKWAQLIHDTINGAAAKLMGTESSQSAKDAAYERIMARKAAREAAQAQTDVDLLSGYRLETTGN